MLKLSKGPLLNCRHVKQALVSLRQPEMAPIHQEQNINKKTTFSYFAKYNVKIACAVRHAMVSQDDNVRAVLHFYLGNSVH